MVVALVILLVATLAQQILLGWILVKALGWVIRSAARLAKVLGERW